MKKFSKIKNLEFLSMFKSFKIGYLRFYLARYEKTNPDEIFYTCYEQGDEQVPYLENEEQCYEYAKNRYRHIMGEEIVVTEDNLNKI